MPPLHEPAHKAAAELPCVCSSSKPASTSALDDEYGASASAKGSISFKEIPSGGSIGILFIAHQGVTNPTLWENWRNSDPEYRERLRFFIFRNKAIKYTSAFCDKYDLGLRLRTQWCSSTIVRATVDSLRLILRDYQDIEMIYTVSGADIPIQAPAALFMIRSVVTEGTPRTVRPFQTVLGFTPEEVEKLKGAPGWRKGDEYIRQEATPHVQWCGLSRKHAAAIVNFSDLERILRAASLISDTRCPDEWVLGTILTLCNIPRTDIADWPITDQYRAKIRDCSPIVWHDVHKTKRRVLWAPPRSYRKFTLGTLLQQVSRREGNLFFRKVAPLKQEEVEGLWAMLAEELAKVKSEELYIESTETTTVHEAEAVTDTTALDGSLSSKQWEEKTQVDKDRACAENPLQVRRGRTVAKARSLRLEGQSGTGLTPAVDRLGLGRRGVSDLSGMSAMVGTKLMTHLEELPRAVLSERDRSICRSGTLIFEGVTPPMTRPVKARRAGRGAQRGCGKCCENCANGVDCEGEA